MWATVAKYLVKAAVWAAGHPDVVKGILNEVVAIKNAKDNKG